MKLSDATTADQLIFQLSAEGFRKVEGRPTAEEVTSQAVGLYTYCESRFPEHPELIRQVDIYPRQIKDRGDAGLSASIDASGRITGWFAWESYVGNVRKLEPDQEVIQVLRTIDKWLED